MYTQVAHRQNDVLDNKYRLIQSEILGLEQFLRSLRNEMNLSVETAIQIVMVLIGLKYWLEKRSSANGISDNVMEGAEIEKLLLQYINSDIGISVGANECIMDVPVIFVRKFLDTFDDFNLAHMNAADRGLLVDRFLKRCFCGDLERLRVPLPIQDFLIGCLSPQKGETIFDPCCGVGDLLIGSMRYVNSRLTVAGIEASRIASRTFMLRQTIEYANDESVGLVVPAKITPGSMTGHFYDIAMCYPTMGRRLLRIDNPKEVPDKISNMSEIQALMHCVVATRAGGRIGIMLPDVLIESEAFDGFRKWMELRADLVFSYAFDRRLLSFSFPSASVSGLIFVKRDAYRNSIPEIAMAAEEPVDSAVASFKAFRADRQIW